MEKNKRTKKKTKKKALLDQSTICAYIGHHSALIPKTKFINIISLVYNTFISLGKIFLWSNSIRMTSRWLFRIMMLYTHFSAHIDLKCVFSNTHWLQLVGFEGRKQSSFKKQQFLWIMITCSFITFNPVHFHVVMIFKCHDATTTGRTERRQLSLLFKRSKLDLESVLEAFVISELLYDPLKLFFAQMPTFLDILIQNWHNGDVRVTHR